MTKLSVVGVTIVALVLGATVVSANVAGLDTSALGPGVPYVRLYDPPSHRLEIVVNQGDGQAFAALAQDPLLRRPQVFRAGVPEAAYRAQRPLLGWLAWGLSGGQGSAVPLVLVLLSVVGFAALGGVVAWLLRRRGLPPVWAFLVLVTPGALVTLDWTGPECLGTAVALGGVALWGADRRGWALLALVAAGLFRESLLLVPLALGAHAIVVDGHRWRSVVALAVPLATYAAWVGVVWLHLDALPSDAGRGRLAMPFTGLLHELPGWRPSDLVVACLLLVAGGWAAWIGRRDPYGWTAGAFVVAAAFFGPEVWARVEDFARVLVPVAATAVVVLAPELVRRRSTASTANIRS